MLVAGTALASGPRLPGAELLEVHAAHAAPAAHAAGAAGRRGLLLLRALGDEGLGGPDEPGDRGGVLQRGAGVLGRVDEARLGQVLVLEGGGVEAVRALGR